MSAETGVAVAPADARAWVDPARPVPHLYVHLPFCARKCPYCDFNSHAGREHEMDRYADALAREARRWTGLVEPETVFVGGGTPTHGSAALLDRWLGALREALPLGDATEFTIEANPGSLDREKVRVLRRHGIDRASVGVQSFDDGVLARLGRIHSAADAVRGLSLLREGGMPRFSLDLMLATPGQDEACQARDLARAIDLAPEHVSTYVLTFEEGTAFTRQLAQGLLPRPDPQRELRHLHMAIEALEDAGLLRYEISNFARPGAESRHNLAYWRNRDWIGLGAGAHSHVRGLRWKNIDDPADYAARCTRDEAPEAWREQPPAESRAFEFVLMGLRLLEGVDLAHVLVETGIDIRVTHAEALAGLVDDALLVRDGDRIRLTARGLDLANHAISRLAP